MNRTVDDGQMHLSDMREMTIHQSDTDESTCVIAHRPRLLGACGLDVLSVGLRLPEPLGHGHQQASNILRDGLIPSGNPSGLNHATSNGVIASICPRSARRSSRSS